MEWISVNDRLPETSQNVIIIRFSNGRFYLPDMAEYYGGQFFPTLQMPDGTDFNADWITHWMPLPEPPKV